MFRFCTRVTTYVALLQFLLVGPAIAKEGFATSLSNAPSAVLSAWKTTFAILTDSPSTYKIGSAFFVWEDKSIGSQQFYFLTANHNVNPSCNVGDVCPATYLTRDLRLKYQSDGKANLESMGESGFKQVEVVQRSVNPDVAVLRVTSSESSENVPKPLPLPSNCNLRTGEPLYVVGFPTTSDRSSPPSLAITEKDIQTKRWSQGMFVGLFNERINDEIRLYIGATADALEGNSGGPIVNAAGEVISIVVKGASLSQNQFQYYGSEEIGHLDWQTLGVRCETLQDLKTYFQKKQLF